ncbi:MAG: hypothetical protein QM696_11530 [Steroidobacteraceae bacterium]
MNKSAVLSLVLFGAMAATGVQAAEGKAAPLAPARIDVNGTSLPNIGGVWIRTGSFLFDPSVRDPLKMNPPYKPDWMKEFDEHRKRVAETGVNVLDPTAGCLPPGMPRMMGAVYPMEVLLTPGQVTIITEWMGQIRRVYTDGRPHPEDPDITYVGHSIGHWEGDTLVIDTVAMQGDTMLDQTGMKHSDQIHVVERMRLLSPNQLENQLTLHDPVAFTKPWTVTRVFNRAPPGEEMREFVCQENNRNPIQKDGSVGVVLQGNDQKP